MLADVSLKDVTNTRKYWWKFFSAMAESWKKLNTSNVFSLFIWLELK